ncbi:hypothetical protein BFW01_g10473 [Lasiodiplodia theobromae]|uniref:Uncharacterized protein n=1 Tax=Lasiodiplodia theobromae TaxID=45133 RepID=A0A8H7M8I2_9PEZI|nr:hypothetical protein BFW01_g10473 [Lasiodiplodia theobromae]
MSFQNPALVTPFLTRETNTSYQNGKPQGEQPGVRVWYCGNCGWGPMMCGLYFACIVCQHKLGSDCEIDFIEDKAGGTKLQGQRIAEPAAQHGARQPANPPKQPTRQSQQPAGSLEEPTIHPGILQGDGMITIPGQSKDKYTLDQYIKSPLGVIDRLANGLPNDGGRTLEIQLSEICQTLGCESGDVWEFSPLDQGELEGYDFAQ